MPLLDQPKTREIYQSIKRALRLKDGFGLFFIICTPAQAQEITEQLKDDFGKLKKIATLILTEEVAQLHEKITTIQQQKRPDILLISGVEKSLDPYVKSESNDKFGGRGGYYQLDETSLPPLLTHLNLQRESYKQDFPFAIVFFLSPFAYRFLVRRAPDFFDWRSGIFKVPRDLQEVFCDEEYWNTLYNLFGRGFIPTFKSEYEKWLERGIYQNFVGRYEDAITSYDKALQFKPDYHQPWYYRGVALHNLGRYKQAIDSIDKALRIKPDNYRAWNNRGNALGKLGRYEEAIQSYDQAIKFQPDKSKVWNDRGIDLHNLGRYEEAIQSYDQAIKFQPDDFDTWHNRGFTLGKLGRYEEAIQSFNQAIKIQPDNSKTWYGIACCYAIQENITEAIFHLRQAIKLDSQCLEWAKTEINFDKIREDDRFLEIVNDSTTNLSENF